MEGRKPDDYQPCYQLKTQFDDGGIALNDLKSQQDFSKQYCVDDYLVQQELVHIELLKLRSN